MLKLRDLWLSLVVTSLLFTALCGYGVYIGMIFNADLALPGLVLDHGALVMNTSLQGNFAFTGGSFPALGQASVLLGYAKPVGFANLNFGGGGGGGGGGRETPTVISWTDEGLYEERCLKLGGTTAPDGYQLFGRVVLSASDTTRGLSGRLCQQVFAEPKAFAQMDSLCGTGLGCMRRSIDEGVEMAFLLGCVPAGDLHQFAESHCTRELDRDRSITSSSIGIPLGPFANDTVYEVRFGGVGVSGVCLPVLQTTTASTVATTTTAPSTSTMPSTSTVPPTSTIPTNPTIITPFSSDSPNMITGTEYIITYLGTYKEEYGTQIFKSTDWSYVAQASNAADDITNAYIGMKIIAIRNWDNNIYLPCNGIPCYFFVTSNPYYPKPSVTNFASSLGSSDNICPPDQFVPLDLVVGSGMAVLGRDLTQLAGGTVVGAGGGGLTGSVTVISSPTGLSTFPRVRLLEDGFRFLGSRIEVFLGNEAIEVAVGGWNVMDNTTQLRLRFSSPVTVESVNGFVGRPLPLSGLDISLWPGSFGITNTTTSLKLAMSGNLNGPLTIGVASFSTGPIGFFSFSGQQLPLGQAVNIMGTGTVVTDWTGVTIGNLPAGLASVDSVGNAVALAWGYVLNNGPCGWAVLNMTNPVYDVSLFNTLSCFDDGPPSVAWIDGMLIVANGFNVIVGAGGASTLCQFPEPVQVKRTGSSVTVMIALAEEQTTGGVWRFDSVVAFLGNCSGGVFSPASPQANWPCTQTTVAPDLVGLFFPLGWSSLFGGNGDFVVVWGTGGNALTVLGLDGESCPLATITVAGSVSGWGVGPTGLVLVLYGPALAKVFSPMDWTVGTDVQTIPGSLSYTVSFLSTTVAMVIGYEGWIVVVDVASGRVLKSFSGVFSSIAAMAGGGSVGVGGSPFSTVFLVVAPVASVSSESYPLTATVMGSGDIVQVASALASINLNSTNVTSVVNVGPFTGTVGLVWQLLGGVLGGVDPGFAPGQNSLQLQPGPLVDWATAEKWETHCLVENRCSFYRQVPGLGNLNGTALIDFARRLCSDRFTNLASNGVAQGGQGGAQGSFAISNGQIQITMAVGECMDIVHGTVFSISTIPNSTAPTSAQVTTTKTCPWTPIALTFSAQNDSGVIFVTTNGTMDDEVVVEGVVGTTFFWSDIQGRSWVVDGRNGQKNTYLRGNQFRLWQVDGVLKGGVAVKNKNTLLARRGCPILGGSIPFLSPFPWERAFGVWAVEEKIFAVVLSVQFPLLERGFLFHDEVESVLVNGVRTKFAGASGRLLILPVGVMTVTVFLQAPGELIFRRWQIWENGTPIVLSR